MPHLWDEALGRYRDGATGELISHDVLRAAVRRITEDTADRLHILTERRLAGPLDTLGWRTAMRAELRTGYGVAASLAAGGVDQLGPSERGVLGGLLRNQYSWLDQFSLDLSTGRVEGPAALARARLYAGGAHSTYEHFGRRGAINRGHDRERNVLGAADHCEECRGLAARQWVIIGSLPLPGSRSCQGNCRCSIETRAGAEVAA
jgi:hypothetical protein